MWQSVTSSDLPGRARGGERLRAPHRRPVLALLVALAALLAAPASGKVFLTLEEALELAFPGCSIERRTHYLTEDQVQRIEALSGEEVRGAIVHPYVARCDGEVAGTAYFDSHRVRTLPETLMVAVAPGGTVQRVEVVAFREPEEYIPREIWYRQFDGEELDAELSLKRRIRGVTGATLTARTTTAAVRRVLATHRILEEEASSP